MYAASYSSASRLSTDGPQHNVLKIKPPLVFSREDADRVVATLADVLGETALRVDSDQFPIHNNGSPKRAVGRGG